jgi:hypothetical protein
MDGLRVEEEEGFLSVGTGLRVWRICCRLGKLEHGFIHFQHAAIYLASTFAEIMTSDAQPSPRVCPWLTGLTHLVFPPSHST